MTWASPIKSREVLYNDPGVGENGLQRLELQKGFAGSPARHADQLRGCQHLLQCSRKFFNQPRGCLFILQYPAGINEKHVRPTSYDHCADKPHDRVHPDPLRENAPAVPVHAGSDRSFRCNFMTAQHILFCYFQQNLFSLMSHLATVSACLFFGQ